ncbi:hypothetical protein BZARG_2252 [Bizionia argentinensis JUB59]|uniref:Uncharacterized protein n=1 Tax=Bizionia argentinensis JUB59 TaxID=1046627 RepID=G2EGE4_9FLAO|nr:hypothetical protein [Bizionia argentinensis]EGV42483.2 hypothetical protein BZARG_2252 [Bizionia argentinensis JUB59]
MPYIEDKNLRKIFITRVYSSISQIETVVNTMALIGNDKPQVSVLGQYTSLNSRTKIELKTIFANIKEELRGFSSNTFKFGFFNHSEYGKLFIAGHLTSIFLTEVDNRKLAALPAGLLGIFRELGFNERETKNYLTTVKDGKFCLIIRVELRNLETVNALVEAN